MHNGCFNFQTIIDNEDAWHLLMQNVSVRAGTKVKFYPPKHFARKAPKLRNFVDYVMLVIIA